MIRCFLAHLAALPATLSIVVPFPVFPALDDVLSDVLVLLVEFSVPDVFHLRVPFLFFYFCIPVACINFCLFVYVFMFCQMLCCLQ